MAVPTQKSGDPVYDTFIKRSLGTFLPQCIRQLTENRPADPIEFISNSLYKAMDSQLYKEEKEKYLNDCLLESAKMKSERDVRRARLDMLLEAQKESKEQLRQARQEEMKALMHLAKNSSKYGIQLSPRTMKRLEALQTEERQSLVADQPLKITMPQIKRLPDGRTVVVRGDEQGGGGEGGKPKGRWVEVEEVVTTASGTQVTVKTRKWQAGTRDSAGSGASEGRRGKNRKGRASGGDSGSDDEVRTPGGTVKPKRKGMKGDQGSVFGEDRGSTASQVGSISLTTRGVFTFSSGIMGAMIPPDPLERTLAPADNPDIWARNNFECHTLYDHELYIRCDAGGYNKNQHNSPPRTVVREYLESVSRGSTSDEGPESGHNSARQSLDKAREMGVEKRASRVDPELLTD